MLVALERMCEVCNIRPMVGVASTSMPYSCAYCKDCLEHGADPDIVFECMFGEVGWNYDALRPGFVTWCEGAYLTFEEWVLWTKGVPQ